MINNNNIQEYDIINKYRTIIIIKVLIYTSNQSRTDDLYLEGRCYTNLTILVFNFNVFFYFCFFLFYLFLLKQKFVYKIAFKFKTFTEKNYQKI